MIYLEACTRKDRGGYLENEAQRQRTDLVVLSWSSTIWPLMGEAKIITRKGLGRALVHG